MARTLSSGEAGDGFLFDTNAVHKAGGVGFASQGVRDMMVFEFNAQGRSAEMCAVDPTLPCGCSLRRAAEPQGDAISNSGGGMPTIAASAGASLPTIASSAGASLHPARGGERRLSQVGRWDGALWDCRRRHGGNLSCFERRNRELPLPRAPVSELRLLAQPQVYGMPEAVRLSLQVPPPGRHYFSASTYLPSAARWHRHQRLDQRQHARLRRAVRARLCDARRPLDVSQLHEVLGSARVKGGPLKYLVYASEHAASLSASGLRQGARSSTPWMYARGVRGCHGSWVCFFTTSICPAETVHPLNQSSATTRGGGGLLELQPLDLGTELQWPGTLIRAMHVALALEARLELGLQPSTRRAVDQLLQAPHVHNRLPNRLSNRGAEPARARGLIIGMHVRRGDACETFDGYAAGPLDLDAPRSCYALDEYVSAARQLRRLYGTSSVVHLISDSAAVTAGLSSYADFEWRTLGFRRNAVGRGTPNLRVGARQRVYMEARAQAGDPANEEIVHSALADLAFVAEAAVFVGTARSFVSKAAIMMIWARTGVLPPTISLEGDVLHSLLHTRGSFWSFDSLTGVRQPEINDHGWIPCVYALPSVQGHCIPCLVPPHGMAGPSRVDRCMDQSFLHALERGGRSDEPCTWQGKACPQVADKPIY